jgi:hypothetical protein
MQVKTVAGLEFEYGCHPEDQTYDVYGKLPDMANTLLASCSLLAQGLNINEFFFTASQNDVDYLREAKRIAKENGRTLAGIVMQLIMEMAPDHTCILVETDTWIGDQSGSGGKAVDSDDLKTAAHALMEGTQAQAYLIKRWKRLYENNGKGASDVSWGKFLENTAEHGWYGAWLGNGDSTTKETMLTTNANMADRCV